MTGSIQHVQARWPEIGTKGYTVQPFLDVSEAEALQRLYLATVPESSTPMSFSLFSSPLEARKAILAGFRKILAKKAADIAPGFKIVAAIFVTKKAGKASGRLGLHQDVSLVDHNKHPNINVWVPLCDVDLNNGCLLVADGTQQLNLLCSIPPPTEPLVPFERDLAPPYVIGVPMKAGEGFIFDSRLLHASEGNYSDHDRVAALFSLIPESEPVRLSFRAVDDPNRIDAFYVDDDFMPYLNALQYPDAAAREKMAFADSHISPPRKLTLDDFIQLHPGVPGIPCSDNKPESAWRALSETDADSLETPTAAYRMTQKPVASSLTPGAFLARLRRVIQPGRG
jgi:hypothetical protein